MPKILNLSLISKFDNKTEFDEFRLEFPPFSCDNTKQSACEICKSSSHKMKIQYCICKNPFCYEKSRCEKRFVTKVCQQVEDPKIGLFSKTH